MSRTSVILLVVTALSIVGINASRSSSTSVVGVKANVSSSSNSGSSDDQIDEAPCRMAPRPWKHDLPHAFNPQDAKVEADGWVRSGGGGCRRPHGMVCDLCCNGTCCELTQDRFKGKTIIPAGYQMWVPLRFVNVVRDNENSPFSLADIHYQINVLNAAFHNTPFRFHLDSFEVLKNTMMRNSCNTDPCYKTIQCDFYQKTMPALKKDSSKVINVVIGEVSFFGESQFPWASPEDSKYQYILIGTKAFSNMGIRRGTTYGHGKTMAHEMGHYFGLFHTFEPSMHCDIDGDLVTDTPATFMASSQSTDCNRVMDTCRDLPGTDDLKNFMDYSKDACMTHFSAGQRQRMQEMIRQFRPLLLQQTLVKGTCPLTTTSLANCSCTDPRMMPTTFCREPLEGSQGGGSTSAAGSTSTTPDMTLQPLPPVVPSSPKRAASWPTNRILAACALVGILLVVIACVFLFVHCQRKVIHRAGEVKPVPLPQQEEHPIDDDEELVGQEDANMNQAHPAVACSAKEEKEETTTTSGDAANPSEGDVVSDAKESGNIDAEEKTNADVV